MTKPSSKLIDQDFSTLGPRHKELPSLLLCNQANASKEELKTYIQIFDLVVSQFDALNYKVYEEMILNAAKHVEGSLRNWLAANDADDKALANKHLAAAVVELFKFAHANGKHLQTTIWELHSQITKLILAKRGDFALAAALYHQHSAIKLGESQLRLSENLVKRFACEEIDWLVGLPELLVTKGYDLINKKRQEIAMQIKELLQSITDPALKETLLLDMVELALFAPKLYFTVLELKSLIDSLPEANRQAAYGKLMCRMINEKCFTLDEFNVILNSATPETRVKHYCEMLKAAAYQDRTDNVSFGFELSILRSLPKQERNKADNFAFRLLANATSRTAEYRMTMFTSNLPSDFVFEHDFELDKAVSYDYKASQNYKYNIAFYNLCKTDAEKRAFAKRWYQVLNEKRSGLYGVKLQRLYAISELKAAIEEAALTPDYFAQRDLLEDVEQDYKKAGFVGIARIRELLKFYSGVGDERGSMCAQIFNIACAEVQKYIASNAHESSHDQNARGLLKFVIDNTRYEMHASNGTNLTAKDSLLLLDAINGDTSAIHTIFRQFHIFRNALIEYARPNKAFELVAKQLVANDLYPDSDVVKAYTAADLVMDENDASFAALHLSPTQNAIKVLEYLAACGYKRANEALGYVYATGTTLAETQFEVPVRPLTAAGYYRAAGSEYYPGYYRTPNLVKTPVMYAFEAARSVALTLGGDGLAQRWGLKEVVHFSEPSCDRPRAAAACER